jgi:hypothetical protein
MSYGFAIGVIYNTDYRKTQNNTARGAGAAIKIVGDRELLNPAKIRVLKYRSLKRPVREEIRGKRSRNQLECPGDISEIPLYTFNITSHVVITSHRPAQMFLR